MNSNQDALVLGIDSSTTACKALVFDRSGGVVAEGRHPLSLRNVGPDAYEQDAEEWWLALCESVRAAVRGLGAKDAQRVRALSIAHQRETFVICDRRGEPLHAALVWMDARCRAEVSASVQRFGREHLHQLTGKPPCVTPSFYKALFLLRRHAPELLEREPTLLDVHAFLVWRLTGLCGTSLASADPLGMIDMERRTWSTELVEALGLEASALPSLFEPGNVIAPLKPEIAELLGLAPGTPVIAGAGDGQAAGLGAGIASGNRAYLNLGTALVSGVESATYRCDRAYRTLFGATSGTYFFETDLKGGTFTLTWLVEKLLRQQGRTEQVSLEALEARARELPAGAEGLMLVPYWNGVMNPYWDDDASGIMIGFRGEHGAEHIYRAILEGLAFEQRLHSRAVEASLGTRIDEFVVLGGGAKSPLFCQILADILQRRLVLSGTLEATALGAGMLAAVGAGIFTDAHNAALAMASTREMFSESSASKAYDLLFERVYQGLYPALKSSLMELTELRSRAYSQED